MSPTVTGMSGKNAKKYRFFFYSNEEDRRHVHVHDSDENEVKFWLEPEIELACNNGVSGRDIRKIRKILEKDHGKVKTQWDTHFSLDESQEPASDD